MQWRNRVNSVNEHSGPWKACNSLTIWATTVLSCSSLLVGVKFVIWLFFLLAMLVGVETWVHYLATNEAVYFIDVLKCGLSKQICARVSESMERSHQFRNWFGAGRPPLWSSDQSSWIQIQRSRVRFPALQDFLRNSGSGTGSTQPRDDHWGTAWKKSSGSGLENRN
jgi:hypothetical protein